MLDGWNLMIEFNFLLSQVVILYCSNMQPQRLAQLQIYSSLSFLGIPIRTLIYPMTMSASGLCFWIL